MTRVKLRELNTLCDFQPFLTREMTSVAFCLPADQAPSEKGSTLIFSKLLCELEPHLAKKVLNLGNLIHFSWFLNSCILQKKKKKMQPSNQKDLKLSFCI